MIRLLCACPGMTLCTRGEPYRFFRFRILLIKLRVLGPAFVRQTRKVMRSRYAFPSVRNGTRRMILHLHTPRLDRHVVGSGELATLACPSGRLNLPLSDGHQTERAVSAFTSTSIWVCRRSILRSRVSCAIYPAARRQVWNWVRKIAL